MWCSQWLRIVRIANASECVARSSVTNASSDAASSSSNIHAGRTSGDDVLLRREGLISITSQPPRLVP